MIRLLEIEVCLRWDVVACEVYYIYTHAYIIY